MPLLCFPRVEPRIEAVSLEVKTSHEQRMTKQVLHPVDFHGYSNHFMVDFFWDHVRIMYDQLLKFGVFIRICQTPIYGTLKVKHDGAD